MAFVIGLAAAIGLASDVHAHGTNIAVTQVDNRLVVSGGLADPLGYAPMIFVEDDEDGQSLPDQAFSGFGYSTFWQIPGFNISGLAEGSGLFLDVLSRPFAHATPAEYRALWYSNAQGTVPKVSTTPV